MKKSKLPRKVRILCLVIGGVLTDVFSNDETVQVKLIDYDNLASDEAEKKFDKVSKDYPFNVF